MGNINRMAFIAQNYYLPLSRLFRVSRCRQILFVFALITQGTYGKAFAEVTENSCPDFIGTPATASFLSNFNLSDSFDGNHEKRYEVTGSPAPIQATVYETSNSLVLDTGETDLNESWTRFGQAESRIIIPNQSFSVTVKLAIDPSSKGNFEGGLTIFDHASGAQPWLLIGIRQEDDQLDVSSPTRNVVSYGPDNQIALHPMQVPDMQFVSIQLEFDSILGVLHVSAPEFGYSQLYFLSAFPKGFSIGFSAKAWVTANESPGRLVMAFKELATDLVTDAFVVGHYPFSLAATGEFYDQLPPGPLSLNGTVWFETSLQRPYFITAPETLMSLTGAVDLSLYLINLSGFMVTVFSSATGSEMFEIMSSLGANIDAYLPNVLRARGAADYEWVCSAPSDSVQLTSLSAERATGYELVSLAGIGFGSVQGANKVSIGGLSANIISWSDTAISVTIPVDITAGPRSILVVVKTSEGENQSSNSLVIDIFPTLLSVFPESAFADSSLLFAGSNFGASMQSSTFTVGGFPLNVSSWTQTAIIAQLPHELSPGVYDVLVTVNGEPSNTLSVALQPKLELLYPVEGMSRDILTLYGSKFGRATSTGFPSAGSFVLVANIVAEVIAWGDEEIQVLVPENTLPGNRFVSVTINHITSNKLEFHVATSNNPHSACPQHYGYMLGNLQLLSRELDKITPIFGLFVSGTMTDDQQALVDAAASAFDGTSPVLQTSLHALTEMARHADWVLDNGCYKWLPLAKPPAGSNKSPNATAVTELVVAGAVCSTKALRSDPPRQCGYYPNGLPLTLVNNPAIPITSHMDIMQFLGAITAPNTSFVKARLYGEWDRGEAVLISAFSHSILAQVNALLGIQTGTVAAEEFDEMQSSVPGVHRLRAYGQVFSKDKAYLARDPNAAPESINRLATHASLAALRMSQLAAEFEGDLDNQSDDFIRWDDRNLSGLLDGGDSFSINLEGDSLKMHGVALGRILHVVTHFRKDGLRALTDSFAAPKFIVHVPPGLERRQVVGVSQFFSRVSKAFRSINDPNIDDTLSSQELGLILYDYGLTKNKPKGFVKIHLRRAFDLLREKGLQPFIPQVLLNDDGSHFLAIENEVSPDSPAPVFNTDMKLGDTRHFALSQGLALAIDCAAPRSQRGVSRQLFYFNFSDPTFGGALELNGSAFNDSCTPNTPMGAPTNFLVNKWLASGNAPIGNALSATISLAENRALNTIRALVIGAQPSFRKTRQALTRTANE